MQRSVIARSVHQTIPSDVCPVFRFGGCQDRTACNASFWPIQTGELAVHTVAQWTPVTVSCVGVPSDSLYRSRENLELNWYAGLLPLLSSGKYRNPGERFASGPVLRFV